MDEPIGISERYPAKYWHGWMMDVSSATCVRATANCTKGSVAHASCAVASTMRWY